MKIHEFIIPVALAAVLAGGCDSILTGEEGDEQEGTVTVTLNASGAVSKRNTRCPRTDRIRPRSQ